MISAQAAVRSDPPSSGAAEPSAVRLVNLGLASAGRSQAAYHAVAETMTVATPDTVILIRPRTPYVCLGWHDVFDAVLDRAACERANLPVLRRRVGGGTTYLDDQQPFYQFIFHHSRVPVLAQALYAYLLAAPVMALQRLGMHAVLRDINEIEAGGRRIAGIGGGRIGEASVVVGNVLCDFNYDVLPEVWNAPTSEFRKLARTALRDRITTMRQLSGTSDPDAVHTAISGSLTEALGRPILPGPLTPEEDAAAAVWERKHQLPEYLALHADRFAGPMRKLKIAAGIFIHAETLNLGDATLQVTLRVRDGIVETARLEGAPGLNSTELERDLDGANYSDWRSIVADALS